MKGPTYVPLSYIDITTSISHIICFAKRFLEKSSFRSSSEFPFLNLITHHSQPT